MASVAPLCCKSGSADCWRHYEAERCTTNERLAREAQQFLTARAEEDKRQNGKSKLGHQMKGAPPEGSHGTWPLQRSWRSTQQDHVLPLERGNVPVGFLSFRRRGIVRLSAEPVVLIGQRSGHFPVAPYRQRTVLSCPSFDFPFGRWPGCGDWSRLVACPRPR